MKNENEAKKQVLIGFNNEFTKNNHFEFVPGFY